MGNIKKEILEKKEKFTANNVNRNKLNNGINVNTSSRNKYALDRTQFTPNTPKTSLAEEIAEYFKDLNNYAGYLNVVNRLGCDHARILFSTVKSDIIEKESTSTPVRNPAAYFMWKYKKGLF